MGNSKITASLNNSEIIFETGVIAKQANGAVLIQLKGTAIIVSACMSKEPKEGLDFFPLTVDYQERTYAAGKIPGGFFKREGRPKEIEILSARVIDRSIRPLFPEGMRNSVQIICTAVSSDGENDPDILAINGASSALAISDIPFNGPIAAVRVGKIGSEFVVNPTYAQREESSLDLIISGNKEKVLMIEGQAKEEDEKTVLKAVESAHIEIKKIVDAIEKLKGICGKPKTEVFLKTTNKELSEKIENKAKDIFKEISGYTKKSEREKIKDDFLKKTYEDLETEEITRQDIKDAFEKEEKKFMRSYIMENKIRFDKRQPKDIRPISCEVNFLPRTHGSALFTRGQTQSLAVTTLGTTVDEQKIESLEGQYFKHFMLHYSFPPFSVGEVSPLRGPSRREIGHGSLAEKALEINVPSKEKFPYTIRVVSEILESNGSSSMASVCAASLSLMDAGVPIKEPTAGVALGLITKGDSHLILVDIAGIEDHYGDMDFKVAGTKNGITAIQLDLKINGITYAILEEALALAKEARYTILDKMLQALNKPREKVSRFAPKIRYVPIPREKIGEVIGPGGRTIRSIISRTGVTIDIDDEKGRATIAASDEEALNKGIKMVEEIIKDPEVGEIYNATVEKITSFGAFCEILPGKSGLLHISELASGFVKDVSDYLKEGDIVKVKVIGIDDQGKIKLSKKQADENSGN